MSKSCKDVCSNVSKTYIILSPGRDISLRINVNGIPLAEGIDPSNVISNLKHVIPAAKVFGSCADESCSDDQDNETVEVHVDNGSVQQRLTDVQMINNSSDDSDNDEEEEAVQPSTVDQICNIAESTAKDAIQIAKVYNAVPEEEDDSDIEEDTTDSNVEEDFVLPDDEEEDDNDGFIPDQTDTSSTQVTTIRSEMDNLRNEVFERIETLHANIADIKDMLTQLVQKSQ